MHVDRMKFQFAFFYCNKIKATELKNEGEKPTEWNKRANDENDEYWYEMKQKQKVIKRDK